MSKQSHLLRTVFPMGLWVLGCLGISSTFGFSAEKPNVLLLIADDLNDYIEGYDGHPQAKTPHMSRLMKSGVSFMQAHCTIPICGPSRASFLTGIYPHHSRNFGFDRWDQNPVLQNSRSIMGHFKANGYQTLGTGKIFHHYGNKEWTTFGHLSDYGPFPFDGEKDLAHPDVPRPFADIGPIDGSYGPLVDLTGRKTADGKPLSWRTGNWKKKRALRVRNDSDRDPTADELNGAWAVEQLTRLGKDPDAKPFFMAVGFIRPHTPLIVPQRYFDAFPIDQIELPDIQADDVKDTHNPPGAEGPNKGSQMYTDLTRSYPDRDTALRHFIQAYLASVASVDDLVGDLLDALEESGLADNTIVILTSDHGWGMGEKDFLYKNSLWQESTRVPFIVRAPGVTPANSKSQHAVSQIDLFPTLIDLCGLKGDTRKTQHGHKLDGFSLRALLEDPKDGTWDGPEEALTAQYKWAQSYDPAKQAYALRSADWRYIRYENGKEELYHCSKDEHEWTNVAAHPSFALQRETLSARLDERLKTATRPLSKTEADDLWKATYFAKNPAADTNKDGELTWTEYNAHRKLAPKAPVKDAEYWKAQYFKKHPEADTNKDGTLSWPEFKKAKGQK